MTYALVPGGSGNDSGVPLALVSTTVPAHEARFADCAPNALNAPVKSIRPAWFTEAVGWLTTSAICGSDEYECPVGTM